MIWIIAIPLLVGIIVGIYEMITKPPNNINDIIMDDVDIPYYINEQIEALYSQLESNHNLIDLYRSQADATTDNNKRLVLLKRASDLEYKCGRIEEKVYKLLEKWED